MRNIFVSIVLGLALAACGSDGEDAFRPPDTPGAPGGRGAPVASQLTVVSSDANIPTDGSRSATITAFARDATNNLVAGVPVTFSATSAMNSGPRAFAGTASPGRTNAAVATTAKAGRRACRARRVKVPRMDV